MPPLVLDEPPQIPGLPSVGILGTDSSGTVQQAIPSTGNGLLWNGSAWVSSNVLAAPAGMTAQDLLIGASGTAAGRVPVGANGQTLVVKSDGTVGFVHNVVHVTAWGAVANNSTDNTVPINNAASALNALGGGELRFAASSQPYNFSGALSYYPSQRWGGAASGGSSASYGAKLKLTVDLYVSGSGPAYAVVPYNNGNFSQGNEITFENLGFTCSAPGAGAAGVGQAPCKTSCIKLNAAGTVKHCFIQNFFGAVGIMNDHQKVMESRFTSNFYGIDFDDCAQTNGNQVFTSNELNGNNGASIHIGGSNTFDSGSMKEQHLGWSPFGLVHTDTQIGWDASGNPLYADNAPTLTSALSTGTPASSIAITGLVASIPAAQGLTSQANAFAQIVLTSGANTQTLMARNVAVAPGTSTIQAGIGSLSNAMTAGVAVTQISVDNFQVLTIASGGTITIDDGAGHTDTFTLSQTIVGTTASAAGTATLKVNSHAPVNAYPKGSLLQFTPNFAYPIGTSVAVTVPNSRSGITNLQTAQGIAFEFCGNAAIADFSTGINANVTLGSGRWMGTSYSYGGPTNGSPGASFSTTQAPFNNITNGVPLPGAWTVYVRAVDCNCVFEFTGAPFQANAGTGSGANNGASPNGRGCWYVQGGGPRIDMGGSIPGAAFLGSGANWSPNSTHVGAGGTGSGQFRVELHDSIETCDGVAYPFLAVGTINAGDAVEFSTANPRAVVRATGTNPICGVALTGAPGANPGIELVLVQTEGFGQVNLINTGAISQAVQLVTSSGAAPWLADSLANNATGVPIGVTTTSSTLGNYEIDSISITGTPTGGTFTVTFTWGGTVYTTPAIAYNANLATIQAAFLAATGANPLPAGAGFVVTGGPLPGTPVTVTAAGTIVGPISAQSATSGALTGSSPTASFTRTTAGVQTVNSTGNGTSKGVFITPNKKATAAGATVYPPVVFTASNPAWAIPAGATMLETVAVGAGAGGGGAGAATGTTLQAGASAGAAGTWVARMITLAGDTACAIVVGGDGGTGGALPAGGTGGTAPGGAGTNGTNGPNSSLTTNVSAQTVTAKGGFRGAGSAGNSTAAVAGGLFGAAAATSATTSGVVSSGSGGASAIGGGYPTGYTAGGGGGGGAATATNGGSGGGAGTQTAGGAAGSSGGSGTSAGGNGGNGAANTGAGGGGGGGGAAGTGNGGTGGQPGSGLVLVIPH